MFCNGAFSAVVSRPNMTMLGLFGVALSKRRAEKKEKKNYLNLLSNSTLNLVIFFDFPQMFGFRQRLVAGEKGRTKERIFKESH